jgi:hypothetical protein
MSKYSATPLPKKLGIRPGFRAYLGHAPADVRAELQSALEQCRVVRIPLGPLDFMMVFARYRAELQKEVMLGEGLLAPRGLLWACWPKKDSRLSTDLDDHEVRAIGLSTGLVDVKVCSVTETWSALKFVRRLTERLPSPRRTTAT